VHIDIGTVEKFVDDYKAQTTTHLMLDKDYATDFVNFVKKKHGLK
jgi:hypothetical protein